MITRNIRPRVLDAVSKLGTFTILELCREAQLKDRNQAYSQLRILAQEKFLDRENLPPAGAHAPLKLYRLTDDPGKRREFFKQLGEYRPLPRPETESELAATALARAPHLLDTIEQAIERIQTGKPADALEQLTALEPQLDAARTELETAMLELGTKINRERTPNHPAILMAARWRKTSEDLKDRIQQLQKSEEIKRLVRQAVPALRRSRGFGVKGIPAAMATQFATPSSEPGEYVDPAAVEIFMDELSTGQPLVPILRRACSAGDPGLLCDVFDGVSAQPGAWWKYNAANTRYLVKSRLRTRDWLQSYNALRGRIQNPQRANRLHVYSYPADRLTREAYLNLTRQRRISVVSPRELQFLGLGLRIRPTLVLEIGGVLEPLECSFLDKQKSLFAYGPIANDLACWQGAPELRVAACLGMWGLDLDDKLTDLTKPLRKDHGLLIIQDTEEPDITARVRKTLPVKEIGYAAGQGT